MAVLCCVCMFLAKHLNVLHGFERICEPFTASIVLGLCSGTQLPIHIEKVLFWTPTASTWERHAFQTSNNLCFFFWGGGGKR